MRQSAQCCQQPKTLRVLKLWFKIRDGENAVVLARKLDPPKSRNHEIINKELGYRKVYSCSVLKQFAVEQMTWGHVFCRGYFLLVRGWDKLPVGWGWVLEYTDCIFCWWWMDTNITALPYHLVCFSDCDQLWWVGEEPPAWPNSWITTSLGYNFCVILIDSFNKCLQSRCYDRFWAYTFGKGMNLLSVNRYGLDYIIDIFLQGNNPQKMINKESKHWLYMTLAFGK